MWKNISLSAPSTFICVGQYSGKKTLKVVPLTHGGEAKNHKVPVLNMTSVGKCCLKKSLGK
jgi:hypothetical protein